MTADVLILHHHPLRPFPYHRWLADHPGRVVVLAARDVLARAGEEPPPPRTGPVEVHLADTLNGPDEPVLQRARDLIRTHGLTRVITHYEDDMERAAHLRAEFGMPGGDPRDVLPFRDKPLMKHRVRGAGVEVAPHLLPRSAAEALTFAGLHGFPVVSKERCGSGSEGLAVLRDRAQLVAHLTASADRLRRGSLLLEAFVPGLMCHVDGMVVGGRTVLSWPSQYQYDLASFGTDQGARIDLTLDQADPLTPRLLSLTERVLGALRPPGSTLRDHAFHAEIFHTPDDRLVLCEIAARAAGARVRDVMHAVFGINHTEYTTRAQVGLPLPLLAAAVAGGPLPRPRRMSGQVLMMKRPGVVRALPRRPVEDWLVDFAVNARVGDVVPPADCSSDFLLTGVGQGPTRAETERRLRELGARFAAQTEIVQTEIVQTETAHVGHVEQEPAA